MMTQRIVLASNNPGKLKELSALLADRQWVLRPQSDFSVTEAEETGLSFVENAILKARHACRATDLPAVADDSGIEVDYLDGKPGIYSARFAGPDASDAQNCEKLQEALTGVPMAQRQARFHCVIAVLRHASDPSPLIAEGHWDGHIALTAAGQNGFGYDSLFFVDGLGSTAAEMDPTEKNRISHRAKAISVLKTRLEPFLATYRARQSG